MIINDNCNTVSVYEYYKSIDEDDKRYLIKGYVKNYLRKNIELNLTKEEEEKLNEAFNKVTLEYESLNVNKDSINKKKQEIDIISLTYKHDIIQSVIDIYEETLFVDVFDLLNEINVKFDKLGDINKQVKRLVQECKHIRNNIKIKKINYYKKYKRSDDQNNDSLVKSVSKRAIYISLNLEMKSNINIEKTSLYDWVNFNELNEARIALIKKLKNG